MDFQGSCVYTLTKLCDTHVNLPDFNVEVSNYYYVPEINKLDLTSVLLSSLPIIQKIHINPRIWLCLAVLVETNKNVWTIKI